MRRKAQRTAVIKRPDLNAVAAHAIRGIEGIEADFCAIQVGQADLVRRACQRHRLANRQFAACFGGLSPEPGAGNQGGGGNASHNQFTAVEHHASFGDPVHKSGPQSALLLVRKT